MSKLEKIAMAAMVASPLAVLWRLDGVEPVAIIAAGALALYALRCVAIRLGATDRTNPYGNGVRLGAKKKRPPTA